MKVKGSISLDDLLSALDLTEIPEGCSYSLGEDVEFDDVEVSDELMAPDEEDWERGLSDNFDQADVTDLSAAIRRGDKAEAEILLDRIFGNDTRMGEWVQLGRFSGRARERAPAQAAAPMAKVA